MSPVSMVDFLGLQFPGLRCDKARSDGNVWRTRRHCTRTERFSLFRGYLRPVGLSPRQTDAPALENIPPIPSYRAGPMVNDPEAASISHACDIGETPGDKG